MKSTTVEFRPITEENFDDVLKLNQAEDKLFVAPNVYSLAQAWLYHNARPYAIYAENRLVGFVMLDWDEASRECGLWRFLIHKDERNKGYGKATLLKVIEMAKQNQKFDYVQLSYVPGNHSAEHLYESVGFKATGEIDEGEVVMLYRIENNNEK
jgi:diamine N-acetyltransferase